MNSISFDRAADFYDSTRGHPQEVSEKIAASLAAHLPQNASILEVGIGTGRIARPLLKHGLKVTGVDISKRMMERLLDQLNPGDPTIDLVEADALLLPFPRGVFEAALSVHVIHLVSDWQKLLYEVRRVVSEPGSLILGYDSRPDDTPSALLRKKWDEIVAEYSHHIRHDFKKRFQDVHQILTDMGAQYQEWTAAEWSPRSKLGKEIEKVEARTWSSTWDIDEDQFQSAIDELKDWALETFGTLDYSYEHPWKFIWQRFSWKH
jgi:ubiquinone/menaquinone biosynthesis C-methylase UbiE